MRESIASILYYISLNIPAIIGGNIGYLFIASLLLEEKVEIKGKKKLFLLIGTGTAILIGVVVFMGRFQREESMGVDLVYYLLVRIVGLVCTHSLFKCFFKNIDYIVSFFIVEIVNLIYANFENWSLVLLSDCWEKLSGVGLFIALIWDSYVLMAMTAGVLFLFSKTRLFMSIKIVLKEMRLLIIFTCLLIFLDVLSYYWIITGETEIAAWKVMVVSIICFVVLIVLSLWSVTIDKDRQSKYANEVIMQQQHYLWQLEKTHRKLKSLHHDYKNMIAGIYLHAEKGNTEEIQEFLSDKFFTFDKDIEEVIKRQNQLLKIEQIELRSLLLTKIATAEQQGIEMKIEAIEPVAQISMTFSDFQRVLGIFLDNAIEAAQEEENPMIKVLFIQEWNKLIVIIKNTMTKDIDMGVLKSGRFSTKGNERGIGLDNVLRMLAQHSNVLNETYVENGEFTQVLTICKNGGEPR